LKNSSQINELRIQKWRNCIEFKDELKEEKEEIKKKGEALSKIRSLNESLINEVNNLKQENNSKSKWENDESREYLKKKDEEICRLRNHNKKLLDEVKRLKEEKNNCQNQEERRILDEESTKRLEDEICMKVEESLNTDKVKSEIQAIIEEGRQNLLDGITLQLQNEKEDKIQEGQQKILEEIEIHLEDVHAKYDGIISKARVIKDQAKMIDDSIVAKKKIDEVHVQSEGRPSNVKSYRHPHYQEAFQGRQEGRYQHYEGRRWNTCQYSWNKASPNYSSTSYYRRPTMTTNWRSFNKNTWNQRKTKYSTTRHQGLRPKIIDFGWIDNQQWNEESRNIRKSYCLVSSHVKPLNGKL
jgi:DNA repair exonuclease SbcCD ATPase subunit